MRAIVCEKLGPPSSLVLRELPDPPDPGPGEIKVAIAARGVQFVDVLMVAGEYQTKPPLPFIPGGEGAGTVLAVGKDVTDFKVGDAVMTRHPSGAFAEMGTISADAALPVPDGLSVEQAAGFRSAYTTAYHALVQRGRLQAGEVLLVHGAAGGIGLAAVQVGKLLGATVIATSGSDEKLAVVAANGADHTINNTDGFRDRVKELTDGRGADVIYDPIGADVFDESMRCSELGGSDPDSGIRRRPAGAGQDQSPPDQGGLRGRRAGRRLQRIRTGIGGGKPSGPGAMGRGRQDHAARLPHLPAGTGRGRAADHRRPQGRRQVRSDELTGIS